MFSYIFWLGVIIGILFYSITFLFVRKGREKFRIGITVLLGLFIIIGSIVFIGGFEGMPFGMMGLGTLSSSVLLFLTTHFTKWTKSIIIIIVTVFALWTAYLVTTYYMEKEVNFWTVSEKELTKKQDSYSQTVRSVITEGENEGKKGYKFVQLENGKGVIVSLGKEMAGKKINVKKVVQQKDQMIITIDIVSNSKVEKNPSVVIGFPSYSDHLIIKDTTNNTYHEILEE